ncbi:MAG TPA: LEPR-XLL domain-containing protein, partial [Burkholderiales bacterium]|nr:LEPR-XLL domain-containing protein [Burkholderiales bacterium]
MSDETPTAASREYRVRIPSLFQIFWSKLANWFRLLQKWRKQGLLRKALQEARRRRALRLETLEPRVLLSADITHGAGALSLVDYGQPIDHTDVLDTAPPPAHADDALDHAVPIDDHAGGDDPKLDLSALSPAAPAEPLKLPAAGSVKDAGGITLTADSSPEVLFGMAQLVFVSFDGAQGVDYDGPVHIAGVDVPAFHAPAGLQGHESEIEAATLATLEQQFAGWGITFTTHKPTDGEFSTIYIGGDSKAFGDTYYGLSQKVDHGNQDHGDIAFVFSDNVSAAGLNAAQYGAQLAGYAAHELGHLLGAEHEHTVDAKNDPLAEVAFKPYTHVEIAKDVRDDILPDGKLTIDGQEYVVHPKIVAALRDHEDYYYAGAVGPDGFPEFVFGQSILHPGDNATWLTRVLDMAWEAQDNPWFSADEKSEILAWSYGFLTHSAGDHWAHTLINEFGQGIFPAVSEIVDSLTTDQRELANALRHFLAEAYVGDATPGFDADPARTLLPDGDISDDSTPGIAFDAPTHFIYEALIRPFAEDPTPLVHAKLGDDGVLSVDGATHAITRSSGSFIDDGFTVGHKITTAGFGSAANNGVFHIKAVTATLLTLEETTLVTETPSAASGDETIQVFVPYTAKTTITVNDATNTFERASGSFKDDGFVAGQRFTPYGVHAYNGDYLVKSISEDGKKLTVQEDLNSGYEVGTGDEQLIVQGSRGVLLDGVFKLRDKIETEALKLGPRLDFGLEVTQLAAFLAGDPLVTRPSFDNLLNAYLYNWVDDINAGIQDWADVGLAFTKAMFDPQARRDLQNDIGASKGADGLTGLRAEAEDGVGIIDVLLQQLDDPNLDHNVRDGYINRHLLSMAGLPDVAADVRAALHDVSEFIGNLLEPLQMAFLPIEAAVDQIHDFVTNFIKEQIEDVFNIDFEVFEFLTKLNSKMDLATIDLAGHVIPIFQPGDHEKLDADMGLTGAHHLPFPGTSTTVTLPGATFTFYTGAQGALTNATHFDKGSFPAYDNSVTLGKMLLLMEDTDDGVGGGTAGDGQLSALFSRILTDLNGGTPVTYDFSKLNLNGAHGGDVLTATLQGVPGTEGRPWLVSIDGDHVWRADSTTTETALFRVSTQDDTPSVAQWQTTVDAGAQYRVYATWAANVTQKVDNLGDSTHPDRFLHPATNAQYTIKDGTTAFATQPTAVDQRRFAGDPGFAGSKEDGDLGFRLLGTYTFTGTTLTVELSNQADGNVIAGPLLLERVSDSTVRRIQNTRDPTTLAPTAASEYSDNGAAWTDLKYKTGTGNNPLWESQLLRPAFKALFTDWQNGALQFPDLGDPTSPDPNSTTIAKAELPSHATPFAPFTPPADIEYTIGTGANLLLRFAEQTGGADVLQLVNNDDASVIQTYVIGSDTVLAVNIHPVVLVGGQFEDTLTIDLGFSGTPDAGPARSLHITFDGGDEILPNDLTTVDDVLRVRTTGGTPYTLSALDINSTEAVEINGNITVAGEMSVDVTATDAAQYSALADLVHASSAATIDVQGGNIQAGTLYLTAVSTLGLDVAGFSLSVLQIGILDGHSNAAVTVHGGTLTTTAGGMTFGATSAVRAWDQLASNAGSSDAKTDAAVASVTIGTHARANVDTGATLDSADYLHITAGNSVDGKSTADGSKGGAGVTFGLGVIVSTTEASITGSGAVDDAKTLVLTASSNHKLDVLAKATPRGAADSAEVLFDPSATGVVDKNAETIDLGGAHGLATGDRVVYHHGSGGTDIDGLEDGKAYFVNISGSDAKFYDTKQHAQDGGPTGLEDLASTGAGTAHSVKKLSQAQAALADPNADGKTNDKAATSDGDLTLAGALAVNVLDDHTQALVSSTGKVATSGLLALNAASTNATSAKADGTTVLEVTFDPSASSTVDTSAESINLGAKHGFHTGDKVAYHHGDAGGDIKGLTEGGNYFVRVDGDKVSLYDSQNHAKDTANTTGRVDLDSKGSGTKHSLELDRSDSGVGIAVAVNIAVADSTAEISGTNVKAGDASLKALLPDNTFDAEAISGTGDASKTGFAGALALNIAVTSATARIADGASLTLTSSDVSLLAQDHVSNTAKAGASQEGSAKTGVGASVALNIGTTDTHALIGDDAKLTDTHDLKLAADSSNTMKSEATGGAKGGTAVTPVVAISIADNDTDAKLGTLTTGGTTLTGALDASATHTGAVTTTASGDTKSADTGVGISIALTVASDSAIATTARNIDAGGAVSFRARSVSSADSRAKASSAGGEDIPAASKDGKDQGGGVSNQTHNQAAFADKEGGASGAKTGAAGKTDGKTAAEGQGGAVQVAGALGITVAVSESRATIPDGLTIVAGKGSGVTNGALALKAENNTDGAATADASTVVINVQKFDPDDAKDTINETAETIKLGANHGFHTGDAVIYKGKSDKGDAGIGLTDGNTYFVRVDDKESEKISLYDSKDHALATKSTDGRQDLQEAKAPEGVYSLRGGKGGGTGVGIAVAVNVGHVTNEASVGQAAITADGLKLEALTPDVSGDTTHKYGATAIAGASGGNTGVAGALAINVGISNTRASVADNATVTVTDKGDVSLKAENFVANAATTKATQGDASKFGMGASLVLNIGETDTNALIGADAKISDAHDIKLAASSSNTMTTHADGAAGGATAATPVIAITVSNNDTNAKIAALTSGELKLSGALEASAAHKGAVETTATGDTKSGDTGLGISLALTVGTDTVIATTDRDISAGGAVTFSARSTATHKTEAKASVAGSDSNKAAASDGKDQGGGLNNQVHNQQQYADKRAGAAGASDGTTGKTDGKAAADTQSGTV